MFTLQTFTSILAFLSFSVQAFPLSQRDVVAPQILQPNASSVWPIGTVQLVVWDTTGFPAHITNPTAQIILGFNESNSLNLDFNNPLAKNFLLTDGSVSITVPNVPPRDDYLIVLFGDSGDTSPAFAITRIASTDPNTSSSGPSDSTSGPTIPVTSLSISSSVTTPTSTDTSNAVDTPTVLPPTGTTTSSSTSSSSISDSNSGSSSATALAASSTSSSAGWSLHRGGSSLWNSAAPFLMSVAPFVMAFMV